MAIDIIIIGGGIVGTSIARELSAYNVNIIVLEKDSDVSNGTSKANSGIVHAGFDAKQNTKKAYYNVLGNKLFPSLSQELNFPYYQCGSLVLGFDENSLSKIKELYQRGIDNKVEGLTILRREEILSLEKNINPNVKYGLYAKTSGIVSPYEMVIAYYENAKENRVKFYFNAEVNKIDKDGDEYIVSTVDNRTFIAKTIINCAGLYADKIYALARDDHQSPFTIIPRKGEYVLFDKKYGYLTRHTLFQTPTKMGKGVLITPTTHGNIIVGPNATDIDDKDDTSTSLNGLNEIWDKGLLTIPSLNKKAIITNFAGLRAHVKESDDFIIGYSDTLRNFYNVAGIESPGLTAAVAIARDVSKEIAEHLHLSINNNFIPYRKDIPHFFKLTNQERASLIKKDSRYGNIICRCEMVSEGEIVEAIKRGAKDLDAIKRRTRMSMGRCQGGFCLPSVMKILSRELNIPVEDLTKSSKESYILYHEENKHD